MTIELTATVTEPSLAERLRRVSCRLGNIQSLCFVLGYLDDNRNDRKDCGTYDLLLQVSSAFDVIMDAIDAVDDDLIEEIERLEEAEKKAARTEEKETLEVEHE